MSESITITFSGDDKKTFEQSTGINFAEGMKLLMDNLKYGGQLGLDPFWSEKHVTELKRRINSGKMERHDLIEVD
ncbi:MAG: hypothetical protein SR1Q7_00365 [Quinella sp. 1Q7]|nr:hypothetical protein [Quinella sp. 1Q7]